MRGWSSAGMPAVLDSDDLDFDGLSIPFVEGSLSEETLAVRSLEGLGGFRSVLLSNVTLRTPKYLHTGQKSSSQ